MLPVARPILPLYPKPEFTMVLQVGVSVLKLTRRILYLGLQVQVRSALGTVPPGLHGPVILRSHPSRAGLAPEGELGRVPLRVA